MGNNRSIICCTSKKSSKLATDYQIEQEKRLPLSEFYCACRSGDAEQVEKLIRSMSIDEINRVESTGSTALHVASYRGHDTIVKLLLEAGASRSIRNLRYNLTPYDEAFNKQTRQLFLRINKECTNTKTNRFNGLSEYTEWFMETAQAAKWKRQLYERLKIDESFDTVVEFLKKYYLCHILFKSERDKNVIEWFFDQAILHNDAKYIVKAYTSVTEFHSILNFHLAEFLLRFFRWDIDTKTNNKLEKSLAYFVYIFLHNPDLRSLNFRGRTYRGVILCQQDISTYIVGKRILNKSFLSTSIDRNIAEIFAGVGDSKYMRRNLNNELIQHITICIYDVTNPETALKIGQISVVVTEQEVLIMPLSAFQIKPIVKHSTENSSFHLEIQLVECDINY